MLKPPNLFDLFNSTDSNQSEIPLPKEQLIDADSDIDALAEPEYEALDKQLANLMVELNSYEPETDEAKKSLNKTLRHCTLEISKRTREGQIAKHITAEQKQTLLQTTVVGEVGEYMPLVIKME